MKCGGKSLLLGVDEIIVPNLIPILFLRLSFLDSDVRPVSGSFTVNAQSSPTPCNSRNTYLFHNGPCNSHAWDLSLGVGSTYDGCSVRSGENSATQLFATWWLIDSEPHLLYFPFDGPCSLLP
jgi:hypothetical protein